MKLQLLVETLTYMLVKHGGDIEVVLNSGMGEDGHVSRVETIRERKAKTHQETYLFLTEHLEGGGHGGKGAFIQPYQSKIEKQKDIPIIHIS